MTDRNGKLIVVGTLVILLMAVYVFGFAGQRAVAPTDSQVVPVNPPAPAATSSTVQPMPSAPVQPSPAPAQKPAAEPNTQAMLLALSNNFKDVLTAAKFSVAGALRIDRVWLVGSQSAYVEYTDGREARRALIEITAKNPLKFKAAGYFVPGGNDWVLEKGQDKLFKDQAWTLYEFDSISGVWQKQN